MGGGSRFALPVGVALIAVASGGIVVSAVGAFPSSSRPHVSDRTATTTASTDTTDPPDEARPSDVRIVRRRPPVTTVPVTTTTTNTTTTRSTTTTTPATTSTTVAPEPGEVLLPTPPPIAFGQRTFSVAFAGDILPHRPLWRQAQENAGGAGYDFGPMLAGLRPLLDQADLAVCHLETPIVPEGEDLSTAPRYGVPPEIVPAIRDAGFDRCSTAGNHTADRGPAGIDRTVAVLEAHGIEQSGMARTPAEIAPRVFDVRDVRVSHLSYTFSYNGLALPPGEEWRSAIIDPARIIADATEARRLGAEVVIASLHWGTEKVTAPDAMQLDVAARLSASGVIDLVVGHHAHVLQPIAAVDGRWVVYGMGNVLSNMPAGESWPARSQDAAVVAVRITVGIDGAVRVDQPVVHPTWCDREAGWIVRAVLPTLADPTIPDGLRGRLETSLTRTAEVLGPFLPAV